MAKDVTTRELETIWSAAYALGNAIKAKEGIPAEYAERAASLSSDLFRLMREAYEAEKQEVR